MEYFKNYISLIVKRSTYNLNMIIKLSGDSGAIYIDNGEIVSVLAKGPRSVLDKTKTRIWLRHLELGFEVIEDVETVYKLWQGLK